MNRRTAFTGVETLVAIAVVGLLIAVGGKLTHSFTNLFHESDAKAKQQVVQLTADLQAQQAAAQAATAARVAAEAQKQARLDAAHQRLAGAGMSLAKEPNPSVYVQVAQVLVKDADQAMDPIAAEKLQEMAAIVDKLTAQNAADRAAGQAALAAKDAELQRIRTDEAVAVAQQHVAEAHSDELKKAVSADAGALKRWESENDSLAKRLGSFVTWAIVAGILFALIFWVLPVLGHAFPVLAPLAKGVGAVAAGGLHVLHDGEKKVLAAAADVAVKAKADVQAALEKEIARHQATQSNLIAIAAAQPKAAP